MVCLLQRGIVKFDGNTWTPYTTENSGIVNNNVTTIKFDKHGNLWVGAYGYGISRFDGSTWTTDWHTHSFAGNSVSYNSFALDSSGAVWASGDDGLYQFDGTPWNRENIADAKKTFGLSNQSIAVDPAGNIWWGQYFEGIWKGTTVTVTGIAPASEISVTASPNPFSQHTILSFPNPKNEPYTFTLRNSTGGVVWTNTGIRSEEATIDGTNLSDGLYFYSLENGRAKKSSGRLVVKK